MPRFYASTLLLTFFFILSCNSKTDYSFLERIGISSVEWKKDTVGCLSYRYKKTDAILKSQQQLLNLNKNKFLSFFGEPNLKRNLSDEREILFYINQPNLYCDGKVSKENIIMSDVTSIHFIFDKKGEMLEVGMKIP